MTAGALGGGVFQCSTWAKYRSYDGAGRPLFCRWYEDGADEPVAVAVGLQRPRPSTTIGRIASRIYFDGAPAARDRNVDLVRPLEAWARRSRSVIEVFLGSFDERIPWTSDVLPRAQNRIEFLIEPRSDEPLLPKMRKGTRSSIKRAERLGVDVRRSDDVSDLRTFATLYQETRRRLQRTKGVATRDVVASDFAEAMRILVQSGNGRLYLAYLGDEPLAGCFFGCFNHSAYYLQNGSNDRALEVGATPLLLLTALNEFAYEGLTRINLGGVAEEAQSSESKDHGLYAFKLGLGSHPVACSSGTIVTKQLRARATTAALHLLNR